MREHRQGAADSCQDLRASLLNHTVGLKNHLCFHFSFRTPMRTPAIHIQFFGLRSRMMSSPIFGYKPYAFFPGHFD
jgi:hypothetical protein